MEKSPIYLNTAAVGLISEKSNLACLQFQEEMVKNPADAFMKWRSVDYVNLREKTAELLHTQKENIAFIPNFSFGLLGVITAIQGKINKVLLFEDDYPSLKMPFELNDFDVTYVPSLDHFSINLSRIIDIAEKENIEVIIISHVQFLNGFTIDLQILSNFCQAKNILLIVDATQSLGAVDIHFDELQIDVLIASNYKWMNGGWGSGILAIKDSFLEKYPSKFAGLGSLDLSSKNWDYFPSALSYEPGHLHPLSLICLEKAIEEKLELTVPKIQEHNKKLLQLLGREMRKTSFK